jgi:hypothetical protein
MQHSYQPEPIESGAISGGRKKTLKKIGGSASTVAMQRVQVIGMRIEPGSLSRLDFKDSGADIVRCRTYGPLVVP